MKIYSAKSAFSLFVLLLSASSFAGDASVRFSCEADSLDPGILAEVAVDGISLDAGQFSLQGNQLSLGSIPIGSVGNLSPNCVTDHPFSEAAVVSISPALLIGDHRSYTSDCYPLDYNLAGVANWGRNQHVTLTLAEFDGAGQLQQLKFDRDQVESFPHEDMCKQAK